MKPNFFLIGSAKCATTSLSALLDSHPDVFVVTQPKEPNFFVRPTLDDLPWYESLFAGAGKAGMRGESSPSYSMLDVFEADVPRRIYEYEPNARLIYIVRHPIRRIESMWLDLLAKPWAEKEKLIHLGLPREEVEVPSVFGKALSQNRRSIVCSANYWSQISRYRRYFADEQILVLFFEEFVADRQAVLRKALTFLGVDPGADLDQGADHLNAAASKNLPHPVYTRLRSMPMVNGLLRLLRKAVPGGVRERLTKPLWREFDQRPQMSEEQLRGVVNFLGEDTARFLELYGRPADYWDLEN